VVVGWLTCERMKEPAGFLVPAFRAKDASVPGGCKIYSLITIVETNPSRWGSRLTVSVSYA